MRVAVIVLGAIAVLVGATSALSSGSAPAAPAAPAQFFSPPTVLHHYGHIRSLARKGSRYELRFDPAFWLGGVTANRAAVEDRVIRPGEGVPNDYYVRDERARALTYLVPAGAKTTVVTYTAAGIRSTRIPVAELAQIVKGTNPKRRPLFDRARQLGYWLKVAGDTVRSLDQQYQP